MATKRGQHIDVDGYYLNFGWDLGGVALDAVAGYREQDSTPAEYVHRRRPVTSLPARLSLFDASRDDDRETTQLELRLSSSDDTALDWVVGGFYQKNDDVFCVAQMLGINEFFGDPGANNVAVRYSATSRTPRPRPCSATSAGTSPTSSRSAPARAGRRRTRSGPAGRRLGRSHHGGLTGRTSASPSTSPTSAAPTGRAMQGCAATKRPGPSLRTPCGSGTSSRRLNSYLRYDRGFKSGGYNDQTGTATVILDAFLEPYDPEFADSYEAGLKTSCWRTGCASTGRSSTSTTPTRSARWSRASACPTRTRVNTCSRRPFRHAVPGGRGSSTPPT